MLQILSELRKNRNWSQQETAERLGIAKSTYAGYESGYREPSLRALIQIADLFDVPIDTILNRETVKRIELSALLHTNSIVLTLDDKQLSSNEMKNIIAFVKVRRDLPES